MENVATLNCAKLLFENIFFDSDTSSEEETLETDYYVHKLQKRLTSQGGEPSRIHFFIERTVSTFTENEFRSHFRITRNAYEYLERIIGPYIETQSKCGRERISVQKHILSVLWLLATPDSYRSVGNRFNMGKSSLFTCFERIVNVLTDISSKFIKWPTEAEKTQIKDTFKNMGGLKGVIGAIDGTYVPIKAPSQNPEVYINRKCFHGITLQCISLPNLLFSDSFAGYPSSASDIRVFRNSPIYNQVINNNKYFNDGQYIIGDKAYPLLKWCIPPYIDRGNLGNVESYFNICHSKTRQTVERSFALLFGRFRRLQYLDMNRIDLIPKCIIACCVLHNICILRNDNDIELYIGNGEHILRNQGEYNEREVNYEAVDYRNELARILYNENQ